MVIGDSFVEGLCLPDGQDLVGRMRQRQDATIGMGTRGAGPLLELAVLGRFGPELKPRDVMMMFYEGNDWDNLDGELKEPWLREALAPHANFGAPEMTAETIARSDAIVRKWTEVETSELIQFLNRSHTIRNFVALRNTSVQLGLAYPRVPAPQPAFDTILRRARQITSQWGGRFTMVYIPQGSRFRGLFPDQFVHDQLRNLVLADARAAQVPVVDLTPAFIAHPKPTALYASDGHLSALGTQVAVDAIAAQMPQVLSPRR